MMAADIWARLAMVADQYPWVIALLGLTLLSALGTLLALALLSLVSSDLPLDQWEEDDAQHRAVSGRMPLETWRRSGGNWRGDL